MTAVGRLLIGNKARAIGRRKIIYLALCRARSAAPDSSSAAPG